MLLLKNLYNGILSTEYIFLNTTKIFSFWFLLIIFYACINTIYIISFSFKVLYNKLGDYSLGETLDPIPNSKVKP